MDGMVNANLQEFYNGKRVGCACILGTGLVNLLIEVKRRIVKHTAPVESVLTSEYWITLCPKKS